MKINQEKYRRAVRGRLTGRAAFILLGPGLLLGLMLNGCYTPPKQPWTPPLTPSATATLTVTNRLNSEWLREPTNLFTLGPGDRLELELIGETNSNTQTIVCPDGKIYFNVLESLDVWGLTLGETKSLLEQKLAEQIRNSPRVTVSLRSVASKRIWILGRVQSPGVLPLDHPMTLLEALAIAGGTSSFVSQRDVALSAAVEELADLKRSFVIRRGRLLPVDFDRLLNYGDLSQNIYLEPDDFVYLPAATAPEVYVIGAVGQPKSVPYTPSLTLLSAIAEAYGTVHDAYKSHVAIVRGSFSQPSITVVDYNDIVRGKAPNIPLQPGDIVHVPYSPFRYLEKYLETILNTFGASVAINAGSSLVLKEPSGQAGVFIPVGSRVQVIPPLPPVQ